MGNARRRIAAQRARRRRVVVVGVAILLLAGAGVAYFMLDPLAPEPAPPLDVQGDFAGGPSALIYADFDDAQDLHRLDLDSREDTVVTELPESGNTSASPGSSWLAIQLTEDVDGLKPVLYLFDPETNATVRLGVLSQPTFSPDGETLAVLRPVDQTRCKETRCPGDKVVMIVDLDDPDSRSDPGEPGRFDLLGWAGEYLLLENATTPGLPLLQSMAPDGELADLPFAPGDLWGGSPDGTYVVESGEAGTRFHTFSEGAVVERGDDIGIPPGSILGAGAWSLDSDRVAAFAVGDDGALELVTFGPSNPEPQVLSDGGDSSTDSVMWSPDNDAVAFTRFNGTELEAVYCEIDDPDSCEVLFSWTRGLSLLRLE